MDAPDDAIETTEAIVWVENGIIFAQGRGVRATAESTTEVFAAFRDLTEGSPRPVLLDIRRWPGAALESWKIGIENVESIFTAMAIFTDRDPDPVIAGFSRAIDRRLVPFRIFTDEAQALEFLRTEADPLVNG